MSAVLEDHFEIYSMSAMDIDIVVDIEKECYQFPWSAGVFKDCLRAGYTGRICARNSEAAGYGLMSVGAGEAHILNLAVHPSHRRCAVATKLMLDLLDHAQRSKSHMCFLEVRLSNEGAFSLYHQLGFNEIGVRKNYYPGVKGREDAYILAKVLE